MMSLPTLAFNGRRVANIIPILSQEVDGLIHDYVFSFKNNGSSPITAIFCPNKAASVIVSFDSQNSSKVLEGNKSTTVHMRLDLQRESLKKRRRSEMLEINVKIEGPSSSCRIPLYLTKDGRQLSPSPTRAGEGSKHVKNHK